MTLSQDTADWGKLAEPLHGPVPDGRPAYKDNAYLVFWSDDRDVLGVVHFSTSPNAEGRRARFSISIGGKAIEIIEDLDPFTYCSDSLEFGLDDAITVDTPQLSGTLRSTPLFAAADYTEGQVIPVLVAGEPVEHHQQAAMVTGRFSLEDGSVLEFTGRAMRDRTWGYREESANIAEYLAILVVFDDHALTVMRFKSTDGTDVTDGFLLPDASSGRPVERLTGMTVTRDAAGLLAAVDVNFADGSTRLYESAGRAGGFWVPMGWTRSGPTMSAFDEFVALRGPDGNEAFGMAEHGIVRNLF